MEVLNVTLIEKICYLSSSQSLSYREIYKIKDKTIRILIKSDSYEKQCYARAEVLRNDEWQKVYSIPYSLMNTSTNLAYKFEYKHNPASAEKEFTKDITLLKKQIAKILF